jgi:hypothetical protein
VSKEIKGVKKEPVLARIWATPPLSVENYLHFRFDFGAKS